MSDVVDGLKIIESAWHGQRLAGGSGHGQDRKRWTMRWCLHQLIKSEAAQREVRSMAYQMKHGQLPRAPRSCQGFDFEQAHVDAILVKQLHDLQFSTRHTTWCLWVARAPAKRTLPPALACQAHHAAKGKRVRFFSTVDLVNALELEKSHAKHGQLAHA